MPETPLQYVYLICQNMDCFFPRNGDGHTTFDRDDMPTGFPFWDEPLSRSSHGFLDLFGLTTTTRKPPISPGNTLQQISHDVRSCDGAMVRNYGMKYELLRAVSVYYPYLTSPSVPSLIFDGET